MSSTALLTREETYRTLAMDAAQRAQNGADRLEGCQYPGAGKEAALTHKRSFGKLHAACLAQIGERLAFAPDRLPDAVFVERLRNSADHARAEALHFARSSATRAASFRTLATWCDRAAKRLQQFA